MNEWTVKSHSKVCHYCRPIQLKLVHFSWVECYFWSAFFVFVILYGLLEVVLCIHKTLAEMVFSVSYYFICWKEFGSFEEEDEDDKGEEIIHSKIKQDNRTQVISHGHQQQSAVNMAMASRATSVASDSNSAGVSSNITAQQLHTKSLLVHCFNCLSYIPIPI